MTLNFKTLRASYPSSDHPCQPPAGEKQAFGNQCAIRVGIALSGCGVDTSKLLRPGGKKVVHCWFHGAASGHVLRAEELGQALDHTSLPGLGQGRTLTSQGFKSEIAGKTGIIFFKDYWQRDRDREGNPTGDHIDLWDESMLTDWSSWLRVQLGIVVPGFWSDLEQSRSVRFWEVK